GGTATLWLPASGGAGVLGTGGGGVFFSQSGGPVYRADAATKAIVQLMSGAGAFGPFVVDPSNPKVLWIASGGDIDRLTMF
ncbi:MAG TPA: hypothetical protein VHB97_21860, partial [Polyangia bacterium]|nr:hypothetical protein [Polyangia bacterium]